MKETEDCFLKVKNDYLSLLRKEKIFDKSTESNILNLKRIYIPISFWIENKYIEKGKTLFLGFSGGQGSGKTTATKILKIILKKFFKRKIYGINVACVECINPFELENVTLNDGINHPLDKKK